MPPKDLFFWYVNKHAKEWWDALPDQEKLPFHHTRWEDMGEGAKFTIYGLWIDSLRGINYQSKPGELMSYPSSTSSKIEGEKE